MQRLTNKHRNASKELPWKIKFRLSQCLRNFTALQTTFHMKVSNETGLWVLFLCVPRETIINFIRKKKKKKKKKKKQKTTAITKTCWVIAETRFTRARFQLKELNDKSNQYLIRSRLNLSVFLPILAPKYHFPQKWQWQFYFSGLSMTSFGHVS